MVTYISLSFPHTYIRKFCVPLSSWKYGHDYLPQLLEDALPSLLSWVEFLKDTSVFHISSYLNAEIEEGIYGHYKVSNAFSYFYKS